MAFDNEPLEKLKQKLDNAQFSSAFAKQAEPLLRLLIKAIADTKTALEKQFAKQDKRVDSAIDTLTAKVDAIIKGKDGYTPRKGVDFTDGYTPRKGIDYRDGINGRDGRDGVDGKDGSPDTPEDIRNKLESLVGNERLPISAIKGLREELDKRQASGTVIVSGGGTAGGRIVKEYDLSASLDGATRTFALPAFYAVRLVTLSSFPNVLRPTVDYTTDASAMTITFTSQVPDNSLAEGQTLIVLYVE